MMIKFVAHPVPDEPTLEHLVERLGHGKALFSSLANTLRGQAGKCTIYAPWGVGVPRLLADQRSGFIWEDIALPEATASIWDRGFESTQHLMAYLAFERVSAKVGRVLVLEDQGADRSRPAEKRWTHDKLYSGEMIYRILSSASARTLDDALQIVRAGAGWLCAITCADVDRSSLAPSGGDITEADIMRVADRTAWIGLDAYDGDGLIVWSRDAILTGQ